MLGISWNEYLIIAAVALIVIGPKELPAVLRAIGQWTAKIRRMAAEFQGQFREAMREAEMSDLGRDVSGLSLQEIMKQWEPKPESTMSPLTPGKPDDAAKLADDASAPAEAMAGEGVAGERGAGDGSATGLAEHAATGAAPGYSAPSEPAAPEASGAKG